MAESWILEVLERIRRRLVDGGAVDELRHLGRMSDDELVLLAEREVAA